MRSRCEAFEEVVWEHARFGTPLSAEAQAHVDRCPECARMLVEAAQLSGMLAGADCVPPAPDCRRAVMDRISRPQRTFVPVWGYASAGVALASIVLGGVITFSLVREPGSERVVKVEEAPVEAPRRVPQPERENRPIEVAKVPEMTTITPNPSTKFAKDPAPAPVPEAKQPEQVMMSKPPGTVSAEVDLGTKAAPHMDAFEMDSTADVTGSYNAEAARVNIRGSANNFAVSGTMDYKQADVGKDAVVKMDRIDDTSFGLGLRARKSETINLAAGFEKRSGYVATEAERPVEIVVASWNPPPSPTEPSYSYTYTDTDPGTGQPVNCSVERNGDVINVYVVNEETTPSERGSISHENHTDV